MLIYVYSGYGAGFGDLSAGRKLVALASKSYPDATIIQFTNSLSAKKGSDIKTALAKFDPDKQINPVEVNRRYESPDMIIVGPMITDTKDYITQLSGHNTRVPIILMCEYDCGEQKGDVDLKEQLHNAGYKHVFIQRMGLERGQGIDAIGIFHDDDLASSSYKPMVRDFERTGRDILEGQEVFDYQSDTSVAVSYSHRNFKRMLHVHMIMTPPERDADLIILGEELDGSPRDKSILAKKAHEILALGYSRVEYVSVGKGKEILANSHENRAGDCVYRVIHTGRVPPEEARALRALSNHIIGGATGDQSLGEAISITPICVYEMQPWKMDFTIAMIELADKIEAEIEGRGARPIKRIYHEVEIMGEVCRDNRTFPMLFNDRDKLGELPRAILLLASADTDEELKELGELLQSPSIISKFQAYQQAILQDFHLEQNFENFLYQRVNSIITENQSSTFKKVYGAVSSRLFSFFNTKQDEDSPRGSIKEIKTEGSIKESKLGGPPK